MSGHSTTDMLCRALGRAPERAPPSQLGSSDRAYRRPSARRVLAATMTARKKEKRPNVPGPSPRPKMGRVAGGGGAYESQHGAALPPGVQITESGGERFVELTSLAQKVEGKRGTLPCGARGFGAAAEAAH